jgi:putative ABC transport system permease protein
MVSIARKNLLRDKTRFISSVVGVTFAMSLILFQVGMFIGAMKRARALIDNIEADMWVSDERAAHIEYSAHLPWETLARVKATRGVAEAHGLILVRVPAKKGEESFEIRIVGYDTKTGVGGPWKVVEGKDTPGRDEVILDRQAAENNGIELGDTIEVKDRELRVVGLSQETKTFIADYAFSPLETVKKIAPMQDMWSFIVVELEEGTDPEEVKPSIERRMDGAKAYTKEEFTANTINFWVQRMGIMVGAMSSVAFLVGIVVVGITIYTATLERSREYGILKAIGAKNSYIYSLVLKQALICSLVGFLTSAILMLITFRFVGRYIPIYSDWKLFGGIFATTCIMALAAAILPARHVMRIDPATVFNYVR